MKTPILFILSLLIFGTFDSKSQDTIYYNEDRKKVESLADADSYKIVSTEGLDKGIEAVERTYFKSGQLKHQVFFSNLEKRTADGKNTFWYEDGTQMREAEFKNGKKEGWLLTYWPDGKPKRKDFYKKGKFKNGEVWDMNGMEIEHFPFHQDPEFPGGKLAMNNFLKKNIELTPGLTGRVVARFIIDETGTVRDIEIIEGDRIELKLEAYRVISSMPRWTPANRDGEPIKSRLSLPINFQPRSPF